FVKEFREAFSLVLLIEVIIDGPLICAELLAVFEGRHYQTQARHAFLFTFVTLQLAFFCIPANHITNEAMALSEAVYFSNWYSQNIPHLKVPLLLMIQNSQNEITIKAGDLVTINAGTVVNVSITLVESNCLQIRSRISQVLKVAWSACSLVKGLRQN
ncbi:hypothetical protein ILUMI_18811, partial [Ignelater luminosus]